MAKISIERPEGADALAEFVALHDRVYASRAARWAESPLRLPTLLGQTPITKERELQPFVARAGGEVVARVCAAVDGPFLRHWNEKVGHLLMFEALPDTRDAVRALLDEACTWLAERGMQAARNGFGLFDMPYNTDAYDTLPPSMMRQNPPGYHVLIKGAGFETEQGFVDYALEATPELVARWQSALESARRAGFEIVPFRELPHAGARTALVGALERDLLEPLGLVPALARAHRDVRAGREPRARHLGVRALAGASRWASAS